MRAAAMVLAVAAAAILAAPAGAATVSTSGSTLTFAGGAEANDVRVELTWAAPPNRICTIDWENCVYEGVWFATVDDAAGELRAEGDCRQTLPTQAVCEFSWHPRIEVDLGAGDDAWISRGISGGKLHGGAGSDTLSAPVAMTGGPGDDRLNYFATNYCWERLEGGDGADILDAGGDGFDTLGRPNRRDCGELDGGPGPDVFRGGGSVTYGKRSEPVTVTLDGIANDGAPGEGDQVVNPMAVYGTAGADSLTGGPTRERLHGGAGNDRVLGGAGGDYVTGDSGVDWVDGQDGDDFVFAGDYGDKAFVGDVLIGGGGFDKIWGGEGNDDIRVRDGAKDEIACNWGTDKLTSDAVDWAPYRDCEKRDDG